LVEQRSPKPRVVGSNPTWPALKKMFNTIKKFIQEAIIELKKVSWTGRKELIESTWIVLVSSIVLGVYIGVIDLGLSRLLALIMK
jgi:preprotein translocase subunit SecE